MQWIRWKVLLILCMVWVGTDKVCSLTLLPTLGKCSVWYMLDLNREEFSSVNNMHINGHLWLDHRGISGPEWKGFLSGSNELSSLSWVGKILPCSTPSKGFILSSDTYSPLAYFWPFSQLPTWSHNSAHAQYIMIGTRASLLLIEFYLKLYMYTDFWKYSCCSLS